MDIRIQWFLFILFIGMTAVVVSTNASDRVNLVKEGAVLVEYVPSKGVYVSKAYVYQYGDELVISGKVRRPYGSFAVTGHVDIEMLDPEGTTSKKTTATHIPRIVRRKGPRDASFTVRLPIILPKGATVRLGYHSSLDKAFNCK